MKSNLLLGIRICEGKAVHCAMFLKGNDKEHVLRFLAEHTKIINLKKKICLSKFKTKQHCFEIYLFILKKETMCIVMWVGTFLCIYRHWCYINVTLQNTFSTEMKSWNNFKSNQPVWNTFVCWERSRSSVPRHWGLSWGMKVLTVFSTNWRGWWCFLGEGNGPSFSLPLSKFSIGFENWK